MATHNISVKEEILFGWNTFRKKWQFLLLAFVIIMVAGMIPSWLHDWARENMPNITFVFSILGWLIEIITSIGVVIISLKIVDGKTPKLQDIYSHYSLFLNFFLGSLLYGLVVIGGLLLLIIPGIIWGIKYQYTTYLIIDKSMKPLDAFKKSGKITQGIKMRLFLLGLAFIGLTILGVLTFGLGLLITWPVISLAGAHVYRKLSPRS